MYIKKYFWTATAFTGGGRRAREVLEVVMFNDMPHGAFLMFPSMMEKTFGPVRERRAATLGWWLA